MDKKENALRIIRFDNPEYVMTGLPRYNIAYHGCNHEGFEGGGHHLPVGSRWKDIWETGWHKEQEGIMGYPCEFPLFDIENLKGYKWPDPDDERICGIIYKMAEEFPGGDLFLSGSHRNTLWERAYRLVGMENMMTYFRTEPELARELLHRVMDFQMGIAAHYVKAGVELVHLGDDLGMQNSLILGPAIMEEFLVPEYRRLFGFYRERNVLIEFHSCGKVEDALDMLIDLGVNVLNPIQVTANDLEKVRRITHGRMALLGSISSPLIASGPVSRIVEEVRKRMWQLGRDGGYFCTRDQDIPFPEEHIGALDRAVEEYGRYPLQEP